MLLMIIIVMILVLVQQKRTVGLLLMLMVVAPSGKKIAISMLMLIVMMLIEMKRKRSVKLQRKMSPIKVADQELRQKEEEIERRIGHYTNMQKILLVGEGDFSFAACLAEAFGRATNITATSLDDRASVISKYSNGQKNLLSLEDYGATVIHQVDAHTMNRHPDLEKNLYDRIVFNFPHYGGMYGGEQHAFFIERHQKVVAGFFRAAKYMVGVNGEVHVTHKTANPFDRWNIEGLAEDAGLLLRRKADFCRWDYPGYENKKAYGIWPDSTFPVGRCSTFMFSTG